MRKLRHLLLLLFGLCLFGYDTKGDDVTLSDTNMIPKDIPLWTESMLWDKQVTLSSGIGYNDNVFLSPFRAKESAFFVNGLDFSVLRVPLDGWEVTGLVSGEDIRYWRNIGTNSEDSLTSSIRVQRQFPDGWKPALEFRALYEKQVLDISTRAATPATALVEGYSFTAQPSVRKDFDFMGGVWSQLEVPITHWSLDAPLDNYWDVGPVVTLGFNLGTNSDLTMSYGASFQSHDQWVALDQFGRTLPQHLKIFQDRTELAWHQYWDPHRHLRSSTRLIFAYDEDNGGGYFNFYQYQIVEDLLWQTTNWQIKASAQQVYEDYPVQGVGVLNGQFLDRNLLDLSLELERRIYKHLKTFAKVEYHHGHSNYVEGAGDYFARVYSGGLRWEF